MTSSVITAPDHQSGTDDGKWRALSRSGHPPHQSPASQQPDGVAALFTGSGWGSQPGTASTSRAGGPVAPSAAPVEVRFPPNPPGGAPPASPRAAPNTHPPPR